MLLTPPHHLSSPRFDDNLGRTQISQSSSTAINMLSIQSLINHPAVDELQVRPPITTQHGNPQRSPMSVKKPIAPSGSSAPKRQKLVKDAAVFVRGEPTMAVNFPPFECTEISIHLSKDQKQELDRKHQEYEVYPSGGEDSGLIGNYVRHIPYSSEKKQFFMQTGREAFDVFQYTFVVPNDPEHRIHTVMWDYNVGLIRVTPFFKACRYSKTTPSKALQTNPGLKELSYSITGGALAAQGYWMPYQCARAMCLTFCYPIRWALTPVFGPSFIKECLPQSHEDFARFKIDPETTRMAALEADGWRVASRFGTPESPAEVINSEKTIPRSVPQPGSETAKVTAKRPRATRPVLRVESTFSSDTGISSESEYRSDSPPISPKSKHQYSFQDGRLAWTSINRVAKPPLARSIVQTRALARPYIQDGLWRASRTSDATELSHHKSDRPLKRSNVKKRPASRSPSRMKKPKSSRRRRCRRVSYSSSSESDDADITPTPDSYKRATRDKSHKSRSTTTAVTTTSKSSDVAAGRLGKYTPSEVRAAQCLIDLSFRDSQLAVAHETAAGKRKRRVSVV